VSAWFPFGNTTLVDKMKTNPLKLLQLKRKPNIENPTIKTGCWRLRPVLLATQEAMSRRIKV
jgi:hypothetical protein